MILEVFPSGPIDTNGILIGCPKTKKAAIIDAPQDVTPLLLSRVEELGLTVEMLLLTHSHQDHIADVALIKKKFKIPVYIHPLDAPNLEEPGADLLPIFIQVKPVKPDHLLADGQVIELGSLTFKVIHTPGHTPGGVCFYSEEDNLLLSGDTLFRGSCGRIDFPLSSPADMWRSLKKLAALPLVTRVYSGHGDPTTIGKESHWLIDAERRFSDE